MARVAPEDRYAGLADPKLLAREFPRPRPGGSRSCRTSPRWRRLARRAEEAGRAVKGVSKSGGASASAGIGGMVLLTSHGFSGAYLGSRHSISMQAIAGEGTAMETDYDFSSALHAADLDAPEKIGRTAGETRGGAAQSAQGLDPQGAGGVRLPASRARWSAISPAPSTAARSRARRASSRTSCGERMFAPGINIIDDPLRQRGLALAAVRRRGRRRRAHGADRRRRAQDLAARQRDRARARACNHRPRAARRLLDAIAGADQSASRTRSGQPGRADQGHRRGLLRHRPDRLGRQHGHRRLQPRRRRLLDREGPAHLSGERGDHRGPHARHLPHAARRPTICNSATAPTRRPCGWRG